ncbi:TetR/AcrR family transcriptional regulator [Enterovibrio norvegicus]|uniref:TetR/AcrR family transcriptional regulator n=1 Tax=Enterovibrio norvegicus TaxID=188144 RepID=UPI001F538170|nr:TetR/AcrR family transcriptional regulator [Enterovibrio norvegicus]
MSLDSVKAPRGRPKTLNRNHILEIAMLAYWQSGTRDVSINEICRQANVSKPGLYREFGNEDGLMTAVLHAYLQAVLMPLLEILQSERPFHQVLDELVMFIAEEPPEQQVAKGCLMVKMRESSMLLGQETQSQIVKSHKEILGRYETWIQGCQDNGSFSSEMPPAFAAVYIDAQFTNALAQLARGDDRAMVKSILETSLSVFR